MGPDFVSVKVWGEFALFTRPELKVERLSYPLMTPSAARGVLDAILYRPQMCWHVRRITALEPKFPDGFPESAARLPYRLVGIRRNELQGKIAPRTVEGWMKGPSSFEPYLVDSAGREGAQGQNRTQRNSLLLQHVAYRIDASPVLTDRANRPRVKPEDDEDRGPDTVAKYVGMFQRRVAKGQCFHRPYLGCREFACQFAAPSLRPMASRSSQSTPHSRPASSWHSTPGGTLTQPTHAAHVSATGKRMPASLAVAETSMSTPARSASARV